MLKNYFLVTIRNLVRKPGFTIVNVLGLSIGLAVFILILLYVRFEYSFDKFHRDHHQIFRVEQDYGGKGQLLALVHNPLGPALASEFPEIMQSTRLMNAGNSLLTSESDDKRFSGFRAWYAEPSFNSLFSFKALKGNRETMLNEPFSIALTEETAKIVFGTQDPMGRMLTLNSEHPCQVTGILEDCPPNSHIQFDYIISASTYEKIMGSDFYENWNRMNVYTYVKMPENILIGEMNAKFKYILKSFISEDYPSTVYLKPLTRIHLHSNVLGEFGPRGDMMKVNVMLAIGVFILLIACINFMNLSTARSVGKARETGIRKVVGASRRGLISRYLTESIVLAILSLMIALVLVHLFLPEYNMLVDRQLAINHILNLQTAALIIGISLLTGVVAGSWPAFYISSVKPHRILKGINPKGTGSARVRKFLVAFQFTISVILIIGTLVVRTQAGYLKGLDPGFRKEGLVNITFHNKDQGSHEKFVQYRNELLMNPKVGNASISNYIPGFNGASVSLGWEGAGEGETAKVALNFIDTGFINTYNIKLLAGRNFTPADGADTISYFIMNEAAAKRFRWDDPVGKRLAPNSYAIGLVKDFHFGELTETIEPILFFPIRSSNPRFNDRDLNLTIRSSVEDANELIAEAGTLFKNFFPGMQFEHFLFKDNYNRQFSGQDKLLKIIGYFSLLSIFIASLGLLSMAAFMVESRKKEMALRKAVGASTGNISRLFAEEFIKWILLANLIAWPVSWYLMSGWLQDFPYHQSIRWWVYPLAGLITIIMALGTTLFQTIKSSRVNPARVFQYE